MADAFTTAFERLMAEVEEAILSRHLRRHWRPADILAWFAYMAPASPLAFEFIAAAFGHTRRQLPPPGRFTIPPDLGHHEDRWPVWGPAGDWRRVGVDEYERPLRLVGWVRGPADPRGTKET